ncbi:MAG: UDP-N-acetylglucosamine 2-epimerase (hydrolyzing) [Rhodospirillaceae bacterium]|jgi:UDP-hydrolysing UDP-N-acetyl-D-glucosamine 2-epimerase|nr:UDP-N-acetylglucosamine 2-epimerase (hydrolyzing) [Rhodospirillaceae bacterium]
MKRKVCVAITARPSYSRIRTALSAIRAHPQLDLQLVVTASALLDRYGGADKVIESEGFHIDRRVYMIVEGENLVTSAKSTGFGLSELATVFDDLKPDMVVSIADRFETMATALSAAYMNIPLVHVQGGEVTGSIDEKVRHAITKLADIHLVASQRAADRVIRMGEYPERVHITGCPSIDVARQAISTPMVANDIFDAYGGVGPRLDLSNGYLVVLQHPVTNEYLDARKQVEETLAAVVRSGLPALWLWPNVDAGSALLARGLRVGRERQKLDNIHFFKNLPPEEFLRVLNAATAIVGNSSVAIRECAYLGVPAINIGTRQSGRDRGANVIDVDYCRNQILDAIRVSATIGRHQPDSLYGDGRAGERVAEVLATAPLETVKRLAY